MVFHRPNFLPFGQTENMNTKPDVSVVMSVYNGADRLRQTMESILSQAEVHFEVIVVDDGSTDDSFQILEEYRAKDDRIRLIRQENQGLTKALIKGCAESRGSFIARQDAGDRSLPGRLAVQSAILKEKPGSVLTACGTAYFDAEGNHLYNAVQVSDDLERTLRATGDRELRGPSHHGAVMFRRDAYDKTGGYRLPFHVAQDLDLWTRLAELGKCVAIPEILYEAIWSSGSISHLKRKQQEIATHAILACRKLRLQGKSEEPVLERLEHKLGRTNTSALPPEGLVASRYHYFVGSILAKTNPPVAKQYFDRAIKEWPFHIKARWKRFRLTSSV
jgi:glycosyltransferase involved in cell wall biosynthesis